MGNAVASEVLTAANYNKNAGGWLGKVTSTSVQTFTGSEIDITDLAMTLTVPAGRRLKGSWNIHVQSSVDQDNVLARMYRDASLVGKNYQEIDINEPVTISGWGDDTPSAGSPVYKMAIIRSGGTGTVTLKGATASHEFLVEDIGAAS